MHEMGWWDLSYGLVVKIIKAYYVIYFLQNSSTNTRKCITKRYENAASLWEGLNLCA